ncbi:MAG: hypothetical protein R3C10_01380 [Pirellulales bacterium]
MPGCTTTDGSLKRITSWSAAPGQLQLDDEVIDVRAGMCVVIPPGVRHRAIGRMRVLNIVVPEFDPADEWFD